MITLTDAIVELARKGLSPAAILEELAGRGRPTTIGFITKTLSEKRKDDPSIPMFNKTQVDSVDRDGGKYHLPPNPHSATNGRSRMIFFPQ